MTSFNYWKPDVVIYHDKCFDGMGAAWAAHRALGDKCQYIAADYGMSPPDVTGKNVLIVDFSYPLDVLEKMGEQANVILILDHHETAEKNLEPYQIPDFGGSYLDFLEYLHGLIEDRNSKREAMSRFEGIYNYPPMRRSCIYPEKMRNIFAHFDKHRSGALLTWQFFWMHGEVPLLIQLINDGDLWKFKLSDSKAFRIFLGTEELSIDNFEKINERLNSSHRHLLFDEARAMKRLFDNTVRAFASHAEFRNIGGHLVPTVCCPLEFRSEVGNYLVDQYPEAPFAAVFYDSVKHRKWSLRSKEGGCNVAEIAEQFGGGGHHSSSSFLQVNPHILSLPYKGFIDVH